jgi:hypothetical protein
MKNFPGQPACDTPPLPFQRRKSEGGLEAIPSQTPAVWSSYRSKVSLMRRRRARRLLEAHASKRASPLTWERPPASGREVALRTL